ncbi:MAG TPA: DUF3617 family protein [Anaeromyxobacteraceae bacterium]|nr:DUF3617 family protein [Anaeromyxobacteraceae bacterium]
MHPNRLVPILALSLAPAATVRAEGRMQPGLWEVTATVELPNSEAPPPTTQTECLTQKDVDEDPVAGIEHGACRVTDVVRQGDKVSWKVDCGEVGRGGGELIYRSSTAYDGWMKLETSGTVVKTTIRAKRVGGC